MTIYESSQEARKQTFVFNITLYARLCKNGEIYDRITYGCKKCREGTYSLKQLNDTEDCIPCPNEAICPGEDLIFARPKYW